MGDKSSDKCYCGTPIHQPDPILSSLLAVNESLGFSETSRGPSTGPSGGLYTASIKGTIYQAEGLLYSPLPNTELSRSFLVNKQFVF